MTPSRLSDENLVLEVARLARAERQATVALIACLAELYGRRLHERAGYSSLFTYCVGVLGFSEGEAYDRMRAAKVVHRYPVALRLLEAGEVNLTTIGLLAPHLTRRNHEELLAAASGMPKRQVQELVARRFPKPDVPFSMRRMLDRPPAGTAPPVITAGPPEIAEACPSAPVLPPACAASIPAASPPPVVQPLSPERYRIAFTGTTETRELLECAQDLLRHAVPGGDPAEIVTRALRLLVNDLVKQKYASTSRPRPGLVESDTRYIPAEVKRQVYVRDRGCCAFIGAGGHRCGERGFLEFHHVVPYAMGGRATVDNIQLRCRAHNGYDAAVVFEPINRSRAERELESVQPCVGVDAFRSGTKTPATPRDQDALPLA
jgi:hypothetical protein